MEFVKTVHLVITVKKEGKYYSFARSESGCNNLASIINSIPNITTANVCTSHKQAAYIAACWNQGYIANGCHLYSTPTIPELEPEEIPCF